MQAPNRELAAIFAGGVIGSLARVALAQAQGPTGSWPWATLVANVVAAALLGYFSVRLEERLPLSAYRRPLLGTGLCGALSTFSAVQIELLRMLEDHAFAVAVGYGAATLAEGYAALHAASALTRRVRVVA